MVDYGRAIKRPFLDFKKLGIGAAFFAGVTILVGVSSFMPFLFLIALILGFFPFGYMLLCAKTAMKKDFKLPEWKNWGQLFIKGLLGMIIQIIYFIPTFVIAVIILGTALLSVFQSGDFFSTIGTMVLGFAVIFIIWLITLYVLPMALMRFVEKDSFAAAFNLGSVFKKAFTGDYFVVWLVVLVYLIGVSFVGFLLSLLLALTVIGPFIVWGFVGIIVGITPPMVGITPMTLFGEVYSKLKK